MRHTLFISLLLIFATLTVFWQVHDYDYIYLDDPGYVTENPRVQEGLSRKNIVWAFATSHMGFWIPITWLSFMLDFELYGLDPGGYHLTNLFLHIANTLLLFLVLKRTTQCPWRSGYVAALFALHPLRVESVVWVAERKDVLSTLFWMLTMLAYVRYSERFRPYQYLLTLLALALGLMAKPMLVTLPFVLLLLDFWPLGRLQPRLTAGEIDSQSRDSGSLISTLIWEKLPFFALAGACSVITYLAHQSAGYIQTSDVLSFGARLANAVVAYVAYIWKMIWPRNLAVFYPPSVESLLTWQTAGAGLLLLLITIAIMRAGRHRPYLVVGWLWYLGTLVPVIGLVQAGSQAMADRFTYVPLIGLFIIIAWGVPDLLHGWRHRKVFLGVAASILVLVLMYCAWGQVQHWRNNITLFEHALNVTDNNYVAHNNLGERLAQQGEIDKAINHFSAALRIRPDLPWIRNNLGNALVSQRRLDEAITHYSEALRIQPDYVDAHNNLAVALAQMGKLNAATAHYYEALRVRPNSAETHNNLGVTLANLGKIRSAIDHYVRALELEPRYAEAHNNLGNTLAALGEFDEAVTHFAEALEIKPTYWKAHNNFGVALARQGKLEEAIPHFEEALRLNPDFDQARRNLHIALQEAGRSDGASAPSQSRKR
jgi:tetratricopeptide (TPR) repeat protein